MNRTAPLIHRSSVTLSDAARVQLVDMLGGVLAATLDLHSMTKVAHWNLRGPFFVARHELFDRVAAHLTEQADKIAERIGTLGAVAHGTSREVAKRSGLAPYPPDAVSGEEHIRALVDRLASLTTMLRAGVSVTQNAGDPATEDLFVETLRAVELDMWFLESHLTS